MTSDSMRVYTMSLGILRGQGVVGLLQAEAL